MNIIQTETLWESDPSNDYTKEEMTELCCKPWPTGLECGKCGKTTPWSGQDGNDHWPALSQEIYAAAKESPFLDVVFEGREHSCGIILTEYEFTSCCDDPDIEELVYDDPSSVDIMADYTMGVVKWEGGKGPYTVKVKGEHFFVNLSLTAKSKVTEELSAYIYTGDACGTCVVTIDDSCGDSVTGIIKSTDGQWSVGCICETASYTNPSPTSWGAPSLISSSAGCGIQGFYGVAAPPVSTSVLANVQYHVWTGSHWDSTVLTAGFTQIEVYNAQVAACTCAVFSSLPSEPDEDCGCSGTPCEWTC